jgi:hypothetical protein
MMQARDWVYLLKLLKFVKTEEYGLGYSSMVECLPSMCKALDSIPSTGRKRRHG